MSEPRKEILADGVEIWLGCMEDILPDLGVFDLCLTDPPYGIDIGGTGTIGGAGKITVATEYGKHEWDKIGLSAQQFRLILEHSREHIIWGANHLADIIGKHPGILIWDKKCQNGWNDTFSDAEIASCSAITRAKVFRHLWVGALRKGGEERFHPTQKPVALIEWCMNFLPTITSVLDPFIGSGTSGVAAVNRGISFVGIEREPKYYDIARRRISDALAQGRIQFDEPPPAMVQQSMAL